MALGGPASSSGHWEDVNEQELGGSKVHSEVSGVRDGEFARWSA